MHRAGFLMVVAAFLVGAFLASLDPRDVQWTLFVPVALAGFAGAWLVKQAQQAEARSGDVLSSNRVNIEDSLNRIVSGLEALEKQKSGLTPHELLERIDTDFRDDLARFAEARESLAHIYDLQTYARVMSAFATGERYLNRVWSASADGYLEEAQAYVARAHAQFLDARGKLDEAQRQLAASAPV